ncbi:Ig-like domain-containing protein [Nocardioides sp. C4-1]|uniref:Ig-like domain-containing protein n=1 Tax=Nocardioides sp. C4-1 TaxID=3151851 RepID=UPI003265F175
MVLTNDIPGEDGAGDPGDGFDPTSVVFSITGQPTGSTVSPDGTTLTVPGEGTYTAGDDGVVTFTPVPTFTGPTTPVSYTVTDDYGNPATSTITVVVTPIDPTATDDTASTPYNNPVTLDGFLDDTAGDPQGGTPAPLQVGLTVFPTTGQPAGTTISPNGKTATVADQGSFVIQPDGTVLFTPVNGFVGTTSAVVYQVEDANGTTDTATLVVTVQPGPLALDDSTTTPQNVDVTVPVLVNDTPSDTAAGTDGAFVPGSVRFPTTGQPTGSSVTDNGGTLTVPGEGVYTANPDNTVTFDPEPGFTGTTTPISYVAVDTAGNASGAEVTVTVTPINPDAVDDAANTPFNTPVTFSFAGNDVAGATSAPIDVASGTFEAADNPPAWTISDGGKTITVPTEGSYTLNDDGTVTFTPVAGFTGPTTAVTYTIRDANGTPAIANISVTVRTGPGAVPDTATTPQNVTVTVSPLVNDTPGNNADGSAGDFVESTLVFNVSGQPAGSTVSPDGKTLSVPDEGVYTIDPDGTVVFDPAPSFTGPASPVLHTVFDTLGNPASSTITVTVTPIDPTATDDSASTAFDTPVTLPGALDDTQGAPSAPLVPADTVFPTSGQPTGASVTDNGKTLTFPGEGTYTLNPDGSVLFTPEPGYVGTTTPVTYRIVDTNGTTDTAQLQVTVRRGPDADPDEVTTPQNVTVTINPLTNDTPGNNPDGTTGAWVPDSVVFPSTGQPTGSTTSPDGKTLTVPGEGVYTVDPGGTITLDPAPGFTGEATPVSYQVTDTLGNPATATITIEVTPINPTATDDTASTTFGTPVTLAGATNDTAGALTAPLVPGDTVFPTVGQPAGATVTPDGTTITVPGQGSYVVQPDGSVVFAPAPGFEGTTTPVVYQVVDANGTTDTATLTVTVQEGPDASPDTTTTQQNTPVTLTPLTNDSAGTNADGTPATFDTSTLVFPPTGQPTGATVSADGLTLTVPGEGVYTIDPATGAVTFDPEPGFTGPASPVAYEVETSIGVTVGSTITVTVTPVVPVAVDDAVVTPHDTTVTIRVLANDTGNPGAALDPLTLFLVDPVTGDEVTTVTVPGEGVWTVVDGAVVFDPEPGFSGPVTPIDYVVSDTNGTQTEATIDVTVLAPGTSAPSYGQTPVDTPITVPVLDNVTPAPGETLVPGSVCLLPGTATGGGQTGTGPTAPGGQCITEYRLPGIGTWTVDLDGTITFAPAPGYVGDATIDFSAEDTGGNVYQDTLDIDVIPVDGDGETAPPTPQPTPPPGGTDGGNPPVDDGGTPPPTSGGGLPLPNTGGVALAWLVAALGLVGGGFLLMTRRRRRTDQP